MRHSPELLLWGVPELRAASAVVFAPERRFQLLAVLALQSGQWVSRDHVASLLWPEHGTAEARRNLRKVLFKAHALPGAQTLEATEPALRWTVTTDLLAFKDDLRDGDIPAALQWRRGALLEGIDDGANTALSSWLYAERARIDQDWRTAALDHLQAQTHAQARLETARRLLAVDPLDEVAMAALLEAERTLGRGAEALAEFRRYAERLAEDLGVEPSRALRTLVHDAPEVPMSKLGTTGAGAPMADEDFIGRKAEIAELCGLLARPECQLVTILGPGGIGKSSLARQALVQLSTRYPGASRWVELQDLGDTQELVARIAQMLGIEISDTRDPVEPLARRLNGEPSLLVLDNAEHLPQLPALIDRLLAAAPLLKLLSTSRVRLHSAREWLLPLLGLAIPDEDSRDAEAAVTFDAVRLFEARAAAAQRDFRLDRHLHAVIAITEAVAGMPLALELAASWVRLLPPEEIARELRDSIDLLQRDPAVRGQPARPEHQSLRAVLDGTWKLLTPAERQALAALSVFQGGFTRSAAQRVAEVPLPLLSVLADKSLIAADGNGRFGMHPLIAAYAAQWLEGDDERAAGTRTRHAEFFALHLAALAPHAVGDQRLLVAGVTAEYANCRAAWQRAVDEQRADLVYAMARALWSFFEIRSRYVEGIELLSPALGLPRRHPAAARALTRLRHGLSMLHHRKGDSQQALSLARGGIEPGEHCGDTEAYVGCILNTGMCLWSDGRSSEARGYYERGLQVAVERGDRHCIVWAEGNLGVCLNSQGELDQAQELLTRALAGARELGDRYNTAVNLNNLGYLLRDRERWDQAAVQFEEGLAHCRNFGLVSVEQYLEMNLAKVLQQMGQPGGARRHLEAALAKSRETGLWLVEGSADLMLARMDVAEADWVGAQRRLKRAVTAALAHGSQPNLATAAEVCGNLLAAQGHTTQAAAAWRTALAPGVLDATRQRVIADRLAALPSAAASGDGCAASLSPPELLALISAPGTVP